MRRIGILVVALPLAFGACENLGEYGSRETIGTLGGAAVGAAVGSQIGSGTGTILATGAGALLGGFLGREIAQRLEPSDQSRAESAFTEASEAPVGETVSWRNPDTGNRGTVTPVDETRTEDGRLCREYETTIYVEGQYEEATGTACRRSDGTWEMVS